MKEHLHLGHIGLFDALPLLIAQEKGHFADEHLEVTLTCELGLATVCGKLADRRIDGACLPAPLPVLLSLGAGVPRVATQAVSICSWQGLGLVIAPVRSPARTPAAAVRIGVIAPDTSARFLLHRVARSAAGDLPSEITPVPMAASQLVDFLREGMLDGICAIDPLPALARLLGGAESVADSAGLCAMHPGGVVALRAECAEHNPAAAAALARALLRARDYCAQPAHREETGRLLLAQAPYAGLDSATRDALVAAIAQPGWMSMRFDAPAERAGLTSATEIYLENACRGAAGSGSRASDLKTEIARVFPRRGAAAGRPAVSA